MILRLETAPYRLRFKRPLRVGAETRTHREGHLVRASLDGGPWGYGEVAPLPGLHPESLADALADLRAAAGEVAASTEAPLPAARRSWLTREGATGSAQWGLETALIAARARAEGCTVATLGGPTRRAQVAVQGLFEGDLTDLATDLEMGRHQQAPALKVKVGRRSLESDAMVLALLDAQLPPDIRFRLDGNRKLTVEQVVELLEGIAPERIDYLEEPVPPDQLQALHEAVGLPLALDESLREEAPALPPTHDAVAAWILKPTTAGGFIETLALTERARDHGKRAVLSATFESGLGLSFMAQVAASLEGPDEVHGLGTDRFLAEDLCHPPLSTHEGFLTTGEWRAEPAPEVVERSAWERLAPESA